MQGTCIGNHGLRLAHQISGDVRVLSEHSLAWGKSVALDHLVLDVGKDNTFQPFFFALGIV